MDSSASTSSENEAESSVTINDLPIEMLEEIFGYLDFHGMVMFSSVCKSWKEIAKKNKLLLRAEYRIVQVDTIEEIISILENYIMLKHIRIDYSRYRYETIIKAMITHCNDLHSIDLHKLDSVSSDILEEVVKAFPNLQSIRLRDFVKNGQKYIQLLSTCQHLQRIEISNGIWVTEAPVDLKPIADECPNLLHLDIQAVLFNCTSAAYFIEKKKHQLRSFLCHTAGFVPETVIYFDKCEQLEHVSFDFFCSSFQTRMALLGLSSSRNLRALGLKSCNDASPDNLIKFFREKLSTYLTDLDLSSYSKIDIQFAVALCSCFPELRKLRLNRCFEKNVDGLAELLQLEKLTHLELCYVRFAVPWFNQLLDCKNLKHLYLGWSMNFDDYHLSQIIKYLKLEYLKIACCLNITSKFLEYLPRCHSLREFVIHHCSVTNEHLRILKSRMPLTLVGGYTLY